jgi:hypothetical protein
MVVQLAPQGKVLQRVNSEPDAFIVVRQGVVRVQDRTTTAAGEAAWRLGGGRREGMSVTGFVMTLSSGWKCI